MNTKFIVEQACYDSLMKMNPKLLGIIARLVDDGVSPNTIYKRIVKQSPNLADWSRAAAAFMKRNKNVRPKTDI